MKTSNKILLGITSIIGLCMLSVLIFAKSSLINVEDNTVTGNGKIVKVNYNIGEISFFKLRGKYDVFVSKGEPHLVIETDENIQTFLFPHDENFISIVKSGEGTTDYKREIRIGQMDNILLEPSESIKVYLTTPAVEGLDISGFCKVTFDDNFTNESFRANVRDFAEVNLKITTNKLDINTDNHCKLEVSGMAGNTEIKSKDFSEVTVNAINAETVSIESKNHSKVNVFGISKQINIDASDFAHIKTEALEVQEATVRSTDQTEISIAAISKLKVDASEFSKVKYKGNPAITKNVSDKASLNAIE